MSFTRLLSWRPRLGRILATSPSRPDDRLFRIPRLGHGLGLAVVLLAVAFILRDDRALVAPAQGEDGPARSSTERSHDVFAEFDLGPGGTSSPVSAASFGRTPSNDELRAVGGAIGSLVEEAIAQGKLPGCVVVLGRHDRLLLHKAFGFRQLEPERVPMTEDTLFDLASLTKPIATATSVMILAERGALRLDDPVVQHLPEMGSHDKAAITIRDLLIHIAGYPADTAFDDYEHGLPFALRRFNELVLRAPPRSKFIYSDVGYFVLGALVERVSGKDLASFVSENITQPLRMSETTFAPSEALRGRAAPTEQRNGDWIRGVVHDPRAFRLGGVAGNAGLFATARDVTRYAKALLSDGVLDGRRILSARSVRAMMAPHDVPGGIRALGWDVATNYSSNRGTSLSRRAVGHGGYTGTSLWIDPAKDLFVLFLSNRVHPDGKGSVNGLAGRIATLAGDLVTIPGSGGSGPNARPAGAVAVDAGAGAGASVGAGAESELRVAEFGIDALEREDFSVLRGARVGLIANDGARDARGRRTIDVLRHARGVDLAALLAPEHGIGANRDEKIPDGVDEATGLPIYSLYGKVFGPTPDMLSGIDTVVFDLQDAGARFFTYASTLHATMRLAAERDLRIVLLDRPNPIDGVDVAGPMLKRQDRSFVNHFPLPVRHGMTMGELAEMMNAEEHLGVRLDIVRLRGWRRSDYFDATGHPWIAPSPNLRTMDASVLYPGVALVEGTNVSVGRGTDRPFQVVGAPWIDEAKLARALAGVERAGLAIEPTSFRPVSGPHAGTVCHGVSLRVRDRVHLEPVRVGIAIASALHRLFPRDWDARKLGAMVGSPDVTAAILAGRDPAAIEASWREELDAFRVKRARYLLYGMDERDPLTRDTPPMERRAPQSP